jgi:hypothetical protein
VSGKFANNLFFDLKIAGGSGGVAGQKGIRLARPVSAEILTEHTFDRIVIHEADWPIEDKNSEGNYWRRVTIDGFCYTPGAAIDAQGLANVNRHALPASSLPARMRSATPGAGAALT